MPTRYRILAKGKGKSLIVKIQDADKVEEEYSEPKSNWFKDNWGWILFAVVSLIVIVLLIGFLCWRKKEYKKI